MISIDQWFRSISREDGLVHGLCGDVRGHPHIPDGVRTRTSDIVAKIICRDTYVITVNGTIYRLLEPKPEYEERYPNARKRLIEALPDADDVPTSDVEYSQPEQDLRLTDEAKPGLR